MFGSIGGSELLVILVLALLLFGPRKLPQIGKTVGRALAEFRRASHDFKAGLEREVELEELRDARSGLTAAGTEAEQAVQDVSRIARGALEGEAPASPDVSSGPRPDSDGISDSRP